MAAKRTKFAKFAGIFPLRRAKRIASVMSLEEFAQADYAVEQALKFGNDGPLKARLRTPGAKLLPLELNTFVDIAEKKIRRPRHRIPQDPRVLRSKRFYLALCVRSRWTKATHSKPPLPTWRKSAAWAERKCMRLSKKIRTCLLAARPSKS
jgi:hypothetical protein